MKQWRLVLVCLAVCWYGFVAAEANTFSYRKVDLDQLHHQASLPQGATLRGMRAATDRLYSTAEQKALYGNTESLLATQAEVEGDDEDVETPEWEAPVLFTVKDLRRMLKGKNPSPADMLALKYTNLQITEGGDETSLEKNIEKIRNWKPHQFTDVDAKDLDGKPLTYTTIEKQTLRFTNRELLVGGKKIDLRENYKTFVTIYKANGAKTDALALYDAMKGMGTNEDKIMSTLSDKSVQQVVEIRRAFFWLCHKKGETISYNHRKFNSLLQSWLYDELNSGWYRKAMDAYYSRPVKEDHHYHWSSAAAKWWNDFLKDSDANAKAMIKHGNLLEQGIGYLNQGIFASAKGVNTAVKDAQGFYMDQMQRSDSRVVKALSGAGYVLATIGGSLGTKALDPTLHYSETEEGLFDVAIAVGTFGVGKAISAGAKTAVGARALAQLAKILEKMSRLSYGLRRIVGLSGNASKLARQANKLRQVAKTTKDAARAQKALKAAAALDDAARAARRADDLVAAAKNAEKAARTAAKGDDIGKATKAAEDAISQAEKARAQLDRLRALERGAKEAKAAAGAFRNSRFARSMDQVKAFFTKDIRENAKIYKEVRGAINPKKAKHIADELNGILSRHLDGASGQMTGAQFNGMMDDLAKFGQKHGIDITRTTETVGVFPKGLHEIQLAGFDKMDDLAATVNFAKRHELAHIFHTLQCRATLIDAVKSGVITSEKASKYLKMIEEGVNYRQFEKAVTGISGAMHRSEQSKDVALYAKRTRQLLDGTRDGILAGRMSFPTGLTLTEVYAMFLSKAPAIVGTGIKSLMMRFPMILMGVLYASNLDCRAYGLYPEKFGLSQSIRGFRDFINALISEGYHVQKPTDK
eukprot:TRINITY_DN4941_c0_g1_i1.p1 TRINITY_DN4941_c0_g1~~TRINITY_DN4941_c0_g1_i1.p1  ORF type:complete len:869 (-),score=324.84 TRINITY_DN4941_c0_g1_i1:1289-3895(-)